MLCDVCGKNEATFHYTETMNGETSEHHLCSACAANTDISYYTSMFDTDNPFMQLLSGIFTSVAAAGAEAKTDPTMQVQCPKCKLTYGEFVKNSSFGCATCYDVFGILLPEMIKKLHGSEQHVGKRPLAYGKEEKGMVDEVLDESVIHDTTQRMGQLTKKMKEAVAMEDYEEAARLRDEIAALRKEVPDA